MLKRIIVPIICVLTLFSSCSFDFDFDFTQSTIPPRPTEPATEKIKAASGKIKSQFAPAELCIGYNTLTAYNQQRLYEFLEEHASEKIFTTVLSALSRSLTFLRLLQPTIPSFSG